MKFSDLSVAVHSAQAGLEFVLNAHRVFLQGSLAWHATFPLLSKDSHGTHSTRR
jgi:hypothetical protein